MDKAQARKNTIDRQIRPWGGLNNAANKALSSVPREFFVPEKYSNLAFSDMEIPLSNSVKMLSPKIEGRLLDALNIQKHETVLEIGTGSGYLSAVLSMLCQSLISLECDEKLSIRAKEKLNTLSVNNVELKVVNACEDWQPNEFFDVVILAASIPKITSHYLHLLNIGGRLFAVEGSAKVMSAKLITRKNAHEWQTRSLFETYLEPMQGLKPPVQFDF